MRKGMTRGRGAAFAAVALGTLLLVPGLTACGGDAGVPSSNKGSEGAATQQEIIERAPVADSVAEDSPTIQRIKDSGVMIWGGDSRSPLFSQLNPSTGGYEGFEAGLAYMLAKYITGEPKLENVQATSASREALLQNGTVQVVIMGYSITPERAEKVNFAGPYLRTGDGIMVRADNKDIKTVDDLNGKKVATNPGVGEKHVLDHAPNATTLPFDSGTEGIQALLQGRADAFVLNMPSLISAASQYPDKVKIVDPKPFTELNFGIGLPKEDPAFKKFVNEWLTEIEKEGLWKDLWDATAGAVQKAPEPPKIGNVPGA